jgi:hypothetical protein
MGFPAVCATAGAKVADVKVMAAIAVTKATAIRTPARNKSRILFVSVD